MGIKNRVIVMGPDSTEYPYSLAQDDEDDVIEVFEDKDELIRFLDVYSLACYRITGSVVHVGNQSDIMFYESTRCVFVELDRE